jgi:hypothetical protein
VVRKDVNQVFSLHVLHRGLVAATKGSADLRSGKPLPSLDFGILTHSTPAQGYLDPAERMGLSNGRASFLRGCGRPGGLSPS